MPLESYEKPKAGATLEPWVVIRDTRDRDQASSKKLIYPGGHKAVKRRAEESV